MSMVRRLETITAGTKGISIPPLYHVSFSGELPNLLRPQLPAGMDAEQQTSKDGQLEEARFPEPGDIERTSFGLTIEGCVMATYPNWYHYFEDKRYNYPYVDMWVYVAAPKRGNIFVSDDELSNGRLVWDAKANGEWWALNDISVTKYARIRVLNTNSVKSRYIKPFGDESESAFEAGPEKFDIKILKTFGKTPKSFGW